MHLPDKFEVAQSHPKLPLLAQSGPRPVASLFDVADKLNTKNGQLTFNVKPILFGG